MAKERRRTLQYKMKSFTVETGDVLVSVVMVMLFLVVCDGDVLGTVWW